MSGRYTSDFSLLNSTFWVDLLSQRDVSSQVPINFVTRPSIALTAACFGNNQYSGNAGSLCLSRLLTVGYRRILVDIYWSPSNQKWQLCPVSIPANSTADSSLYNLGKYKCSGPFDLTTITDVLHSYFVSSNADIDFTLIFVDFNLHAAADVNSPDKSAPTVSNSDLPPDSSLLGPVLHNALGPYIYTTENLAKERSNLNESWYRNTHGRTTVAQGYFTTNSNADQILSTPDGWPCEGYLINKLSTRVIFSRGSIDSQLQGYNVSGDAPYIFSTNYTEHTIDAPATKNVSEEQSICFYNAQATTIENTNNSWAVSPLGDVNFNASNSASRSLQNFSACGISPMINRTLDGHTADIEVDPYRNLSMSTVWSWAVNEPRNESSISGASQDTGIFRCAVMDPTSEGHWRAGNCSESHFAACRVDESPYSWMLSNNRQTFYDSSSNACAPNSSFDVPRTGLENTYLWHQVLTSNSPASNEPVWVNLNSIDVRYCWVTGGANATCAYVAESANVARRTVLVPTIAAIIILVITAATIFVKCNSNRRTSRRKRVSEGWDYEGVPS